MFSSANVTSPPFIMSIIWINHPGSLLLIGAGAEGHSRSIEDQMGRRQYPSI